MCMHTARMTSRVNTRHAWRVLKSFEQPRASIGKVNVPRFTQILWNCCQLTCFNIWYTENSTPLARRGRWRNSMSARLEFRWSRVRDRRVLFTQVFHFFFQLFPSCFHLTGNVQSVFCYNCSFLSYTTKVKCGPHSYNTVRLASTGHRAICTLPYE